MRHVGRLAIYAMIAIQILSWIWFTSKGGSAADVPFLRFTGCMMLGQLAASIECFRTRAWGTLAIQVVFFLTTGYGGYVRLSQM